MKREHILRTATDLFTRYGIKGISMDMISGSLHISKKTLYDYFSDKNELVRECMKSQTVSYKERVVRAEAEAESLLDAVFMLNMELYRQSVKWSPAFFRDMEQYPEAVGVYEEYVSWVREKYVQLLTKGTDEGLFRSNTDQNVIINFFREQLKNAGEKQYSDDMEQPDIYAMTILTFLSGIATDKGRREIDSYIPKQFRSYNYKIKNHG